MRLYTLLLHLYPSSFRAEYGQEMRAIFARRRQDAGSIRAVLALWAETLADIGANAARLQAEMLRQDVAYTQRTLRRAPAFTITAILVSALGIGATTAAFSLADHVLVRPLPFPDAGRLVKLWQNQQSRGYSRLEPSPPNYLDWKQASRAFGSMSAYTTISANLAGDVEPLRLDGAATTSDLFRTLGVAATLGRALLPSDDAPGAADTVVLSDQLWRGQFGADANVLGRRVLLNDRPYLVVGIMPASFAFPTRQVQFWTPMRLAGADSGILGPVSGLMDRTNYMLQVVARLAPGVTVEQARAEVAVIAANLEQAYPKENAETGIGVNSLRDEISWRTRMLLVALVGASFCVLLIACTNLASLLLARGLARQRELAVRTALGAGRERLIRQMLTEGLVLAALGGAFGILLAIVAGPLFARLVPTNLPMDVPGMDPRMLGLAALFTLATGLGFGVVPALRVSRRPGGERPT